MSERQVRWSIAAEEWLKSVDDASVGDVLIVGTGYGGSFAARELAAPDRRVWVLERGREHALGEFAQDIGSLPGQVRIQKAADSAGIGNTDGVLDFRRHGDVSVLVGNGLGGGSLVNAGVAVLPDPALFTHPAWPAHYREHAAHRQALQDAMTTAQAVLQAQPFDGADKLRKFQALDRLGHSMGETARAVPITVANADGTSPAGVALKACTRCGNCFTGCNVGAKHTTVTHVLPDAARAGAELVNGLTVLEVRPLAPGHGLHTPSGRPARWAVRVVCTADLGLANRPERWLHAHTVVLAAGALGSTEILLRSARKPSPPHPARPQPLRPSAMLGQRFSTNGDALALGWGLRARTNGMARPDEARQPPADRVGPTITGWLKPTLDVRGQPRKVCVEDGAVPSALTQATLALGAALSLPHRYTRGGQLGFHAYLSSIGQTPDPLGLQPDLDRHALLLLVMGEDEANGRVELTTEDGRDALSIGWPEGPNGPRSPYYQAVHRWLRDAAGEGGFQQGDYLPSPLWKPLPDDFTAIAQGVEQPHGLTVHPLGGCPMGDGPDTAVVDWQGTVFRADGGVYDGLHVLDGAMLPTSVGVNPFITISGLALVAARAMGQALAAPPAGDVAAAPPQTTKRSPLPAWPSAATAPWPVRQPEGPSRTAPERGGLALQFNEHLMGPWLGRRPTDLPATPASWSDEERQREWVVGVDVPLPLADWLANPSAPLQGARMRVWHNTRPQDLALDPAVLHTPPVLEGEGWVALLAADEPRTAWCDGWRRLKALAAFAARRPVGDLASGDGTQPWWVRLQGLWRAAGSHARYRNLDYAFTLHAPGQAQPALTATGRKRLAFAPGQRNLWDALVQLDLALHEPSSGRPCGVLKLEVDLIDMIRRQRLQVARAPDTPAALIGLAQFTTQWLRAVFQTHFWSLRGLDYDRMTPPGPAQHGPLWPQGADGPACAPQGVPLRVPRGGGHVGDLMLELTVYRPVAQAPSAGHLLMIHGLAHGGTVFTTATTGGRNMAAAFLAAGYTVWVLDHRLSNRLSHRDADGQPRRMATLDHTMDDVAQHDIPAAVAQVFAAAGGPIDVLAHCVGAGAFAMATLRGLLDDAPGHSRVRRAIVHAVHPWVVPSVSNQFSGELAALYRDWLPADLAIDPVPPPTPTALDQAIDRLAASIPWPDAERRAHHAHRQHPQGGTAVCNRMTVFYGREWVHANLAEATHRELASLVGPASVGVFRQLFYIVNRQRLTDREGAGADLSRERFDRHWRFPVLFAHGTENRVFDPRSAVRSWHQLRQIQDRHPGGDRAVRLFLPEGYGHMDFLFGQRAWRDVYPALVDFLRDPQGFASSHGVDTGPLAEAHERLPRIWRDRLASARPEVLTGPLLQWDTPTDPSQRTLVVWLEVANDPWRAPPVPVLCGPQGQPLPAQALRLDGMDHASPHTGHRVTLLDGPGHYWVLRLNLADVGPLQPADWPHLTLAWAAQPGGPVVPPWGAHPLPVGQWPWWRLALQPQPARPPAGPGVAPLAAAVTWLATSCRWPGTAFESRAVDDVARAMHRHVLDPQHPAQALVLLGDQIYADATANLFDLQEGDERLAQAYRAAWGGPATRALLASVPTDFTVDDHEFADNWNGAQDPLADAVFRNGFEATLAYQWRWQHPSRHAPRLAPLASGQPPVRGFWRRFHIGPLPAFALDTRTEREPRSNGRAETAHLLSAAQRDALAEWLLDHAQQPKVLCAGSVFGWAEQRLVAAPALCARADGWSGYPATWRWLVGFIVRHQIRHLVFLSGDYHFSGVAELVLSAQGHPDVAAASVVCSGWNASLPFANAVPGDFAVDVPTVLPGSDARAAVRSTARGLPGAPRQFGRVTVAPVTHADGTDPLAAHRLVSVALEVMDAQGEVTGRCRVVI